MCICNSMIRTPYCGRGDCTPPDQSFNVIPERPTLEDYFVEVAVVISKRSTWNGTKVGCVVVQDKQIVSTGYNGTPARYSNAVPRSRKEVFCHAEENAIVQAAKHGVKIDGSIFYTTISPCMQCARMMINAGVRELIYKEVWDNSHEAIEAMSLLAACGLTARKTKSA